MKENLSRLFSVVVAVFLFWYIRSDINSAYVDVHPPIEIKGIPDGKVALVNRQNPLRLTLKGPSSVLAKFVATPPLVRFQLPAGVTNGVITLPIEGDLAALPPFVSIASHSPDGVEIEVDDIIEKEIPVSISFEGKLPTGLRIVSTTVIPPSVLVRGPANMVKATTTISTTLISRSAIDTTFEREVFLKLPVQEMETTPSKVLVSVTLDKAK